MSMGPSEINIDGAWLPDACTLPTAERPLRVAEFDDLSTGAVCGTDLAVIAATLRAALELAVDPAGHTR